MGKYPFWYRVDEETKEAWQKELDAVLDRHAGKASAFDFLDYLGKVERKELVEESRIGTGECFACGLYQIVLMDHCFNGKEYCIQCHPANRRNSCSQVSFFINGINGGQYEEINWKQIHGFEALIQRISRINRDHIALLELYEDMVNFKKEKEGRKHVSK